MDIVAFLKVFEKAVLIVFCHHFMEDDFNLLFTQCVKIVYGKYFRLLVKVLNEYYMVFNIIFSGGRMDCGENQFIGKP